MKPEVPERARAADHRTIRIAAQNMIEYIGEHTWAGHPWAHAHRRLLCRAPCLAALAYLLGTQRKDSGVDRPGSPRRSGCIASAVIGIVVTLFIMLFNHWFEYDYVWKHSNLQMPMKYIASCFWEGQEGSFLLWTFWHVVLGNIC